MEGLAPKKQKAVRNERDVKSKVSISFMNRVISKRSVNSVLNERYLLKHISHPYNDNCYFKLSC